VNLYTQTDQGNLLPGALPKEAKIIKKRKEKKMVAEMKNIN
jgi:hypothetical protein